MRPSPSGASPPCCTGSRCRAARCARPRSSHRPQCRSGLVGATDGPMAVGRTPDEFRAGGDLTVALQNVAVRATATTCDRRPASRPRTCRASSSNSRATAKARSCRGAGRRAIVINPVTPWTAGAISGLAIFAPAADLLTRLSASNSRPDGLREKPATCAPATISGISGSGQGKRRFRRHGCAPIRTTNGTTDDLARSSFSGRLWFSSRTARASRTARPAVGPPRAEPRPEYRARGAATPAAAPSTPRSGRWSAAR